ncbi:tol-pal system-associated acyl-CoA thioesterase [Fontimonas sp. SYSU GA230001]|uniref:tol-pal system-associated acyl-CoA thioesterase n=1 Tax=Fontimonas sp. SYSU GA230001 TaxID=3142450 RepID=UPI0032B36024
MSRAPDRPEFRFPVRVYYEDTDASGVTYHANYLRWFERGRTEWLRALGIGQEGLRDGTGAVFTVASLQIDFRRPARLDDALDVVTMVAAVRRASLLFEQTLVRSADGELLARAAVKVGCVSHGDFRPIPLPEALEQAIEAWRKRDGDVLRGSPFQSRDEPEGWV